MKPARPTLPATVLVVDDEDVSADVLSRLLERRNLPHRVVKTGEDAVRLLGEESFGCVVADKNLPGIDGLEVIRTARKLQPFCACILITGYSSTDSVLEALRLGAADYLEKPFPEVGLVLQKIESAIRHQRVAFERNTLADVLRAMQAELRKKDQQMFAERTELEVLESVLDLKVADATSELRGRVEALEAELRIRKAHVGELKLCLADLLAYARALRLEAPAAQQATKELERRAQACVDSLAEPVSDPSP